MADAKVVREIARAQARAVYKKTMTETETDGDKAMAEAKAIYKKAKDEAEAKAETVRSNARAVYKKTMTEAEAVRSNDLNPNSLESLINFEAAKGEAEKVRDNAIYVEAQTVYDNAMAEPKAAWNKAKTENNKEK